MSEAQGARIESDASRIESATLTNTAATLGVVEDHPAATRWIDDAKVVHAEES